MKKLRIAGIVSDSVVDGPGVRYTIFTQGCLHKCPGCHNIQTHDMLAGTEVDIQDILDDIYSNKYVKSITFSGGDPLEQPESIAEMIKKLKEKNYNILIYTGYLWEEILKNEKLLKTVQNADVVIDGRYIESLRSLSIPFRGSSNQRAIDVKKSLELNKVVCSDRYN